MEQSLVNQKWSDVTFKKHNDKYLEVVQRLSSLVLNMSGKLRTYEFINNCRERFKNMDKRSPWATHIEFFYSFTEFYDTDDLSYLFEHYPDEYIQLFKTFLEFRLVHEDIKTLNSSILTIENLIRIPIYCN
jgi:hypothetical protein